MKKIFTLLPVILFFCAGCSCDCRQEPVVPPPCAAEEERTEISYAVEKPDNEEAAEELVFDEMTIPAVSASAAQPAPLTPVQTKVNAAKAAAPQAQAAPEEEAAPESYLRDGRYLHPWAERPFIENGQELYPAPWSGEELRFGIHYTVVRAGTAYIKTKGVARTDFGPAYLIETTANSAKVIDAVFKVRDINYSWISVKDYSSFGYSQSIREGNYSRDEWVTFNVPEKTFKGAKNRKGKATLIKGELEGPVQDMLTSLFYVRAHARELSGGKDVIFDVNDGEKTYPLVVKYIKKETVKVPAGKFNCIVAEPRFRKEGIFVPKGKSIKVWITDDEKRLPVKMETEVFIGSVSASLEEYKKAEKF